MHVKELVRNRGRRGLEVTQQGVSSPDEGDRHPALLPAGALEEGPAGLLRDAWIEGLCRSELTIS